VPVKLGASDGTNTEIYTDALKGGEEIVVGEIIDTDSGNDERDRSCPK